MKLVYRKSIDIALILSKQALNPIPLIHNTPIGKSYIIPRKLIDIAWI
jgi:hypothetical protein